MGHSAAGTAVATDPPEASSARLACQKEDNDAVGQASHGNHTNHSSHGGIRAPLFLPPASLHLLPWDHWEQSQGKEGRGIGQHIGQSDRGTEGGCVCQVVLEIGQLGIEEPKDLVADHGGHRKCRMLECPNEAVTQAFTPLLCKLDDHQVGHKL